MRPLPPRPISRSANWALRIALFAPVLGCLSIIAHRGGWVTTPEFLLLLQIVAGLALVALVLCVVALRSLWQKGTKGGRKASWALVIIFLVLAPFAWSIAETFAKPPQSEISTDIDNPPLFESEFAGLTGAADQAGIPDGYPDLTGRRYRTDMETVLASVERLGDRRGITRTAQRGRIGADDELHVEFRVESLILKMPGMLVIRVTDEGETTFVDMRARSLYANHDRGFNAALITRLYGVLDEALIGTAGL